MSCFNCKEMISYQISLHNKKNASPKQFFIVKFEFTLTTIYMKNLFLLILIGGFFPNVSGQYSSSKTDSVSYVYLKQDNKFFVEIPFGIGITSSAAGYPSPYGEFRDANLYFGITGKYYLQNQVRLDLGYKASFIGTDDFEYLEYNPELLIRANYPLLKGKHNWGELIFLNPSEYFFANTPKYRFIYINGGYLRHHIENKLFLGINYSSKSFIKVQLPDINRTKSVFDYFEVGAEVLFRVANSERVLYYYDFYAQNPSKIGWNSYLIYTYNNMLAKLEIGGHNGPMLKFTIGVIIPG